MEEALSRRARASIVIPSGEVTITLQVIRSGLEVNLTAAFEIADEDLGEVDEEAVEDSGTLEDKLIAASLHV